MVGTFNATLLQRMYIYGTYRSRIFLLHDESSRHIRSTPQMTTPLKRVKEFDFDVDNHACVKYQAADVLLRLRTDEIIMIR